MTTPHVLDSQPSRSFSGFSRTQGLCNSKIFDRSKHRLGKALLACIRPKEQIGGRKSLFSCAASSGRIDREQLPTDTSHPAPEVVSGRLKGCIRRAENLPMLHILYSHRPRHRHSYTLLHLHVLLNDLSVCRLMFREHGGVHKAFPPPSLYDGCLLFILHMSTRPYIVILYSLCGKGVSTSSAFGKSPHVRLSVQTRIGVIVQDEETLTAAPTIHLPVPAPRLLFSQEYFVE